MLFWIAAAALAAAVTYAVTRPLADAAREASADSDAAAADLAVYKDQLSEIDADVARGAMPTAEAEAARTEVARRMLRRAEPDPAVKREGGLSLVALNRAYAAAAIALPVLSLALYLQFGAPGLPAQPLSARLEAPVDPAKGNDLVAKVEAALRANPEDGRGWDVIAPVYAAQARFADAASAYANALRLNGENLARLQGFADARIRSENGLIPEDARKALERARTLDPKRVEPRMWLALAKEQDGDAKSAIADYRAMLAEAPADAHWRKMLEERIAALESGAAAAPKRAQRSVRSRRCRVRRNVAGGTRGQDQSDGRWTCRASQGTAEGSGRLATPDPILCNAGPTRGRRESRGGRALEPFRRGV